MNIAVILAGGKGERLGTTIPKQFLTLGDRLVIEHTIAVFEGHPSIDEIAVVCNKDYMEKLKGIVEHNRFKKVQRILPGGKERYESSLAAINEYDDDSYNLIFHDAVRPLVSDRIIDDCISALNIYSAIDVAIKTVDTIIQVDENDMICSVPNRKYLRNGQTPQCFKRGVIKRAYDIALKDPLFTTTDDCGVVRRYLPEVPIKVVDGESANMKLTVIEDIPILEYLMRCNSKYGSK